MSSSKSKNAEALEKISKDRTRTNLFKKAEQNLLSYLVQKIPSWMTSNMLTGIGFCGSILVTASIIMAAYIDRHWMLLGILGFAINWFGDSLDGRVAYYRNKPRKWYGFCLDFSIDWITNIFIGTGFTFYVMGNWKIMIYLFITLYGWAMITALLRYKITNKYTIDSGLFGPTEVRIIISLILACEVFFPGTIHIIGPAACAGLLTANIIDMKKLLKMADALDIEEKKAKAEAEAQSSTK